MSRRIKIRHTPAREIQTAPPPPAPKEKKTRKKETRTFGYRGIHFLVVPTEENKIRLFTMVDRGAPDYQCTVLLKDERTAVQALAKVLLAEEELASISIADTIDANN